MTWEGELSLNIKNKDVERLIDQVTRLTGESKTEAVRRSLEERCARLDYHRPAHDRAARVQRFLVSEVWPTIPADQLGRTLSKAEEEAILGYGKDGV